MRILSLTTALLLGSAAPAFAQEAGKAGESGGLMSLQFNLMFWTLILFALLYFVLKKWAFGPITKAVDDREKHLEELIEGAKRDRDAAAALVHEQKAAIDAARVEAQKIVTDARATGEKVKADMVEQTHKEQQDMLDRARREIDAEKSKAIAELRKEAVDLALAGATKVIEQNLQSDTNRKLVEGYLSQLGNLKVVN